MRSEINLQAPMRDLGLPPLSSPELRSSQLLRRE